MTPREQVLGKLTSVPASNFLYAGTVPAYNFLDAGTVPASKHYLLLLLCGGRYPPIFS